MIWQRWQNTPIVQRIRTLRWVMPLVIVAVVVVYQLGLASYVQNAFNPTAHFLVEIAFYSVAGPVVTWLTLKRIGQWLGEKEEAERAARSHERYLASITGASADAILSLDTTGVIRSWNRGAGIIFGYTADEIIGEPLTRLFPSDLGPRDEEMRQAQRADAEGVLRHYETERIARDGRRVVVDITRTPLRDDNGRVVGTSVIMRDITQRKTQEAIVEEERARIARDLHDGLAQNLYFLGLKLDYIRKQVPRNPESAVNELRALRETIQTNIQDVRRTVFALRPVDLEGLGFGPAMRQYTREFGEQAGLDVTLKIDGGAEALPAALEPVFFRLVQESLNNIAKHASAHCAWVELDIHPGQMGQLTVRDDGVGFDPQALRPSDGRSMGLRQMRERVASLGGHLYIESTPGNGTALSAEIPLGGRL
jgi:PAS domain S-box-containing protein